MCFPLDAEEQFDELAFSTSNSSVFFMESPGYIYCQAVSIELINVISTGRRGR